MSDVIEVDIQEENPIEIIEVYVDENAAQTAIDAAALAQDVLAELLLITGNIPEINTIIVDNSFEKEGQLFTGFADTLWNISGVRYTNPTDQEITIPLCAAGLVRQDRIVLDTNNDFVLVPGEEVEANPVPPAKPVNTLDYTFIPVSDSEVGEPEAPIVGDNFQQKNFDRSQIYTGIVPGTNVVIPLDYKGRRVIILQGTIVNIKGLSTSLIEDHAPSSENPHEGKIFTFINETANPIIFNHFEASEDIFFILKSASNLVVPSKERIDFMLRSFVMEEHYRSWVDLSGKLDKVTTVDIAKVYLKNADGTQGMKSVSDFGDMTTTTNQTVSGIKTFLIGMFGMRNVANTFTSFFSNSNTASRTYTFKDRSSTIADDNDLAGKMNIPSGTTNFLSKFISATTIGISRIFDNGTHIGISTINTPTKDITLNNIGNKEIGVEDSESTNSGRDLVVTAGRTVDYLLNSEFTEVSDTQYAGSGAAAAPNGDIYFQGFGNGLYKLTLGTNTITSVPAMGAYYGGISIGFDESIYQTPYGGGVLTRDNVIVSGTSAYTTLGILSSKLSNKLYASFNGNIQYSTDNGVSFTAIQAGSIGISKMCEDSFGNVYALISGFLWKQTLGTGSFSNTTIALAGSFIAIDTNDNIYSVNDSSLFKLDFGGTVYSLFKDISTLPKGGVTGIAIDTNNRIFISCGLNNFSLQFQLFTDALGTPDLDGGTLKMKAGTGKGTGVSKVQIITGQKTTSGTDMQAETVRMEINEEGLVSIFNAPVYADNTAALAGDLIAGMIYKDSSGNLKIVY